MSTRRGILNPLLYARAERAAEVQALLRDLDRREGERDPDYG